MTHLDTQTAQLLTHLHRGGDYSYYWQLAGKRSTWWNGTGAPELPTTIDLYFGVNPATSIPEKDDEGNPVKPEYARSRNDCVAAVNALYSEHDAKDFDGSKERALAHVKALPAQPSVTIDSGGGYHSYWLLNEPFIIRDDEDREYIADIQRRWVEFVGSDDGAKDLARILRVPGTRNSKYADRPTVAYVWTNLTACYDLVALVALLPPGDTTETAPQPPRVRAASGDYQKAWADQKFAEAIRMVAQAPAGEKHKTRLKAARLLGGLIPHGLATESQIESALYHASVPQKHQNGELETIRDAVSYGKAKPLDLPPPPPAEPHYDADGHACCPEHPESRLKRSKKGNWWCPIGDFHYWWRGEGYTAPQATEPPDELPLPSQIITRGLEALGYRFALNLCDDRIEVNGTPMNDTTRAEIRTRAWDANIKPLGMVETVYTTEAARHAYHPIRDYLTGLEWDGNDHIGLLAAHMDSPDPLIEYPDGKLQPLHAIYLKRWLVGAVAKVLDQHQNMMLVLSGPQNIGKSELVRWLCRGIPDRFVEAPIKVDDKDTYIRLMSRFIWEVSELDATTRRADASALKAFITCDKVTVRRSYAHYDTDRPALASMVGTVNDGSGFLVDETGNRRFLVMTIARIDWSYTKLDVDQLWAQAVALYRAGEPWRLLPVEAAYQSEQNKAHELESVLDGWLTKYFDCDAGDRALMTSADIVDHLHKHDIKLSGSATAQAMELSRVLVRLGVQKVRTNRWRGYRGIAPRDNPVTTSDNLPDEVVTRRSASQSQNDNVTARDGQNTQKINTLPPTPLPPVSQGSDVVGGTPYDYSFTKKVVTGCHVVTEASQSGRASDNLPDEVVTEVVTPRRGAVEEVDLPDYHTPDLAYVRQMLAVGDEQAMRGIRTHCALRRVDVDETIAAARAASS
jgi:predicted P-loop ATPase